MRYHKKSLAQHFLRNRRILQNIVDAANLSPTDAVLEVGPGEGGLTELLLHKVDRLIAVEKDARLIPVLQQKFANEIASGKLELIHADIVTLPVNNQRLKINGFKVVSNLPYYITGQFLRRFLQTDYQPSSMTLLLQKEVARRIIAADGRESVLSISVKAYGMPRYIATVKAGSFTPPPKVDSAIITIESISKEFFRPFEVRLRGFSEKSDFGKAEEEFFSLLKRGFAHPRKLLASNLGATPEMLEHCGIPHTARAENLSLHDWKSLTSCLAV